MQRTTKGVLDEIMKRLGSIEARLAGLVDPSKQLVSSHDSRTVNKAGRKNETAEIAEYANQLRMEKKTWKEVWRLCKQRWPGNKHVKNQEQVRAIWRRQYRVREKAD